MGPPFSSCLILPKPAKMSWPNKNSQRSHGATTKTCHCFCFLLSKKRGRDTMKCNSENSTLGDLCSAHSSHTKHAHTHQKRAVRFGCFLEDTETCALRLAWLQLTCRVPERVDDFMTGPSVEGVVQPRSRTLFAWQHTRCAGSRWSHQYCLSGANL